MYTLANDGIERFNIIGANVSVPYHVKWKHWYISWNAHIVLLHALSTYIAAPPSATKTATTVQLSEIFCAEVFNPVWPLICSQTICPFAADLWTGESLAIKAWEREYLLNSAFIAFTVRNCQEKSVMVDSLKRGESEFINLFCKNNSINFVSVKLKKWSLLLKFLSSHRIITSTFARNNVKMAKLVK